MGRSIRIRPRRLGEKLLRIREYLDLERDEIINHLDYKESKLYPQNIWSFEKSEKEPNLLVLLAYSRLVNISTDILIDDSLDLPKKIR